MVDECCVQGVLCLPRRSAVLPFLDYNAVMPESGTLVPMRDYSQPVYSISKLIRATKNVAQNAIGRLFKSL
jgi:hypothetical protein